MPTGWWPRGPAGRLHDACQTSDEPSLGACDHGFSATTGRRPRLHNTGPCELGHDHPVAHSGCGWISCRCEHILLRYLAGEVEFSTTRQTKGTLRG